MLADVIAFDAAATGKRRAGVFTGLWTAVESAVAAFGALILGAVLAVGGFIASEPSKPVAQPASAESATLLDRPWRPR